jgi:hypothetical protein
MVEVFKTNVTSKHQARVLVDVIQYHFKDYRVNFDLEDCDRILRIESSQVIEPEPVVDLLKGMGIIAEILLDEPVLLIIS